VNSDVKLVYTFFKWRLGS